MRVAHLLRKYNPAEWGGTETAVHRLLNGLSRRGVWSLVYAPALAAEPEQDPLTEAGHEVRRYRAFLPVWGLGPEQRRQLMAIGGNLMSVDLLRQLRRERGFSVIHTHAVNRLGGIGLAVARARNLPLVVTIHGGVEDLPEAAKQTLLRPLEGGWEWGKIFGWLLRSRRLLADADAIITCNRKEAELLEAKYPQQRVLVQPHAVALEDYEREDWPAAAAAFPDLRGRRFAIAVGRLDPVKNQGWLINEWTGVLGRHPHLDLVLAGACTDEAYGKLLKKEIRNLGLDGRVWMTGGLPPGDPRLIGLLQRAEVLVLPSRSETFGLVLLEAWAAGRAVISSRTSGALDLVEEGKNGWLFDLDQPASFHEALDDALNHPERRLEFAGAGRAFVAERFESGRLAGRVQQLYEELIEEKKR